MVSKEKTKKYKANDVKTINGLISPHAITEAVALTCGVMNNNAEILSQLLNRVEKLEKELSKLKKEKSNE